MIDQEVIAVGYKIRDKNTGLYQLQGGGNGNARWSKVGETWSTIGALKNHIHRVLDDYYHYDAPMHPVPDTWEVVVLKSIIGDTYPVSDLHVKNKRAK